MAERTARIYEVGQSRTPSIGPADGTGAKAHVVPVQVRILAGITAVLFLAYSASFFTVDRPGGTPDFFWDTVVYSAWMLSGVVILIWRARSSAKIGLGWYLIATYILLNLAADLIFQSVDFEFSDPDLVLSDVIYLTSYLFIAAGLIVLSRRGRSVSSAARIDGLILGLTASAAILVFYDPLSSVDEAANDVSLATLLYPVLDLIFLTIVLAGLVPLRFRPTPAIGAILVAIIAVGIGDVIYLDEIAAGEYVQGTPLELTWAISNGALILAALLPNPYHFRPEINRRWTVFTPAAASLIAVGLLAWELASAGAPVVSGLALAALALASVRLILTMIELRRAGEGYAQARRDYLTGLVNRRGFTELADGWLAAVREDAPQNPLAAPGGLVLVGVTRIKDVIDVMGRRAGDDLLRGVAQRLTPVAHPFPLARLDGAEFAILVTSGSRVDQVAQGAVTALDEPLEIQGLSIRVSAAVGVARPTAQSGDLDTFLRSADVALTQARHRGQNIVEFNPADDPAAEGNVGLMADLHRGLERNELLMYFQPLVRVRDRKVIGAEALVRWNHPTRGLLPPGAFIEAAEQGGLIGRVTQTALAQSCGTLREWLESGRDLTMSVNISGIDLMDERLPDIVAESLAAHGLPPERLTLEITETAIGSDPELSLRTVGALRDLGVCIAIDDFGVGYSSLSQLMDTQVDEIKLDGSFLRAHDGGKREAALRATQHLATAIGATMVAEGVETMADFELLERLGCDLAQGYHFSRPLPAAEFSQLVQPR